jgi:hypothetical protein
MHVAQAMKWTVASGVVISATALLYGIDPSESKLIPPCPFRAFTGLYCQGCGSLRAAHQLLHGRLLAAFDLNPLMVVALPFLGYILVSSRIERQTNRPPLLPKRTGWFVLTALLLFAILRNFAFHPFSVLAP